MKFAHKSGIVWKIYLIKLYICSANMDIFDKDVHLYNNTGTMLINNTVQAFYIDNILKSIILILVERQAKGDR